MITPCCLYYSTMYSYNLGLIMLETVQIQVEKWCLSQRSCKLIHTKEQTRLTYNNKEQLKETKGIRIICFSLSHMYAIELEGEKYFDFSENLDVPIV